MPETVTYVIDGNGFIISTGEGWDRFASANDAPELTLGAVLGHPLLDFISDLETRYFYKVIIGKVRSMDKSVTLPFRCDSPELRRYMEMDIAPAGGGEVRFACRLLRKVEREPLELIRAADRHSEEFLHMCSWFKKVMISEGEWTEPEDAITRMALFQAALLPRITHITCPDCSVEVFKNLDAM